VSSNRRVQANRDNSKGSTGPVSAAGKEKTRLNALKTGLFSKELVLTEAGETPEEFIKLRDRVWEYVQPANILEEMLVREVITSYWRLQRPRRCEMAETRRLLSTALYRRRFEKEEEANALKARFLRDHLAKKLVSDKSEAEGLNRCLEETRRQLRQSSLGLEFLIGTLGGITATVESHGYLPADSERLLVDACGPEAPEAELSKACLMINQIIKTERDKLQRAAKPDGEEPGEEKPETDVLDQGKQVLVIALRSLSGCLKSKKNMIKKLEAVEDEAHLGTLILPAAEHLDRLHRAESAMERRFSRALGQLLTLQGVSVTATPR
jgi:hypothetical protein